MGYFARLTELSETAIDKVCWSTNKPDSPGVWFGAKWQNAGYFHVQRYRIESTENFQSNDEYWFGPLTEEESNEEWTYHIRCNK